jgi:hypothetical protein
LQLVGGGVAAGQIAGARGLVVQVIVALGCVAKRGVFVLVELIVETTVVAGVKERGGDGRGRHRAEAGEQIDLIEICGAIVDGGMLALALIGKEGEDLVPEDGTADAATKLLTAIGRACEVIAAGAVGNFLIGVEIHVAEEGEQRAVEFVGAVLGDEVDDGAFRTAIGGREALGTDVVLFDGLQRDLHHCAAHRIILVVHAVDGDVHVASAAAVDG